LAKSGGRIADALSKSEQQSVFRLGIKPDRRRARLVVDPEDERRLRPPGVTD
jgi:hypothetical protein